MSLSNKALLVNLSISQWAGRKLDRSATATVESTYATNGKVGQYTKKLLPGSEELADIGKAVNAFRTWFYTNTLPWHGDGTRILSNANYMQFTAEYRNYKATFESRVARFMTEYPLLRREAQRSLGQLFNPSDYPSEASLRNAFSCDIMFMPLPDVTDFRIELADSERQEFESKMQEAQGRAMRDCWERVYDAVSHAVSKLKDPNAKFRDSLVENIREVCGILPRLNITDDANLEAMRVSIEQALTGKDADSLRTNINERTSTAKALSDIESKMAAFMGVAS